MERLTPLEKDYYLAEEWYSDDARSSDSSDDEVQKAMARIAGIERPKKHHHLQKKVSNFEKEMDDDLDAAFSRHTALWFNKCALTAATSSSGHFTLSNLLPVAGSSETKRDSARRSDVYAGSDTSLPSDKTKTDVDPASGASAEAEELDVEGLESLTDRDADDLLYDPNEDEDNEAWVSEHRKAHQSTAKKTDALLNCPCCMAVLCLDCQRHEVYKMQYRAMFVENCRIVTAEKIFMPSESKRSRKRRSKTSSGMPEPALRRHERFQTDSVPDNCSTDELFHPVQCEICSTEVGVIDVEEVYHFHNVLSSYA